MKGTGTKMQQVMQIRVTLLGIAPPIWRRFLVQANTRLSDLAFILNEVMGWQWSHLHVFAIGDDQYSSASAELPDTRDEARAKLSSVVPGAGFIFEYEYDMGDGWIHEVEVEDLLPVKRGQRYPRCVAGERACPPEDCGGVGGYEEFLRAIRNPRHPDHRDMLEWIGGKFDPEAFDLRAINLRLEAYGGRRGSAKAWMPPED